MQHQTRVFSCVLAVLIGGLKADENPPFGLVPATISEEAQAVLRDTRLLPPGQVQQQLSYDEIRRMRKMYDESDAKYSEKALNTYEARIYEIQPIRTKRADVRIHLITPETTDRSKRRYALIWIHGGGFALGSPDKAAGAGVPVFSLTGIRTYSVGYRLAPEHPYPAALDDCLAVYRKIIKEYQPKKVAVFGASAGGNLAVTMALKARKEGLTLPACVVAITPWADLAKRGDSYNTLAGKDPILQSYEQLKWCVTACAAQRTLTAPFISPVYADFYKFPPTLITSGTRDLFLSTCSRLYRKMKEDGVDVELSVWEGMWHGFRYDPNLPEPRSCPRFVGAGLGLVQ